LTNEALHRPIDALAVGEVALIAAIDRAGLDPGTAQRLCELGFDEGVDVEILHRAPFGGDPLARASSAKSGSAPGPATTVLANIGNATPYVLKHKSAICFAEPGSCCPKSLDGKPRTTSPRPL
jgi:ferrous iron transport protein A